VGPSGSTGQGKGREHSKRVAFVGPSGSTGHEGREPEVLV
jgi:hypothetical protein